MHPTRIFNFSLWKGKGYKPATKCYPISHVPVHVCICIFICICVFPHWKGTGYKPGAKCYPINPCPSVCANLYAEPRLKMRVVVFLFMIALNCLITFSTSFDLEPSNLRQVRHILVQLIRLSLPLLDLHGHCQSEGFEEPRKLIRLI